MFSIKTVELLHMSQENMRDICGFRLPKKASNNQKRGGQTLGKIEKLIEPGEEIIYRARFGALRAFWELVAITIGLVIGAMTGPGIVLVIIILVVGIYSGRKHQKVVVTNQRLIYLQGWGRPRIDEINLRQVESIRNNGQRITVTGSGGTKLVLPHFLADEAGLGRAIRNAGSNLASMNA